MRASSLNRPNRLPSPALFAATFVACTSALSPLEAQSTSPIQLRDITAETGITFIHTDGSSGKRYIVETVASGLATFDYNNDGLIDILFLNGTPLPGNDSKVSSARNALYRNDGDWRFTDVTEAAGLVDSQFHLGVCVGDYDNDGDSDIFLNNFGPNILYRNNGNETFTDVTAAAGLPSDSLVGAGASFLDIEGDGDLDLFVANYVDFTFKAHHIGHMNGLPAYVGPLNYPSTSNVMFRNNGDLTFTDISEASGISSLKGAGMGVIAVDYDNDQDSDLIVGNDLRPDFVLRNDGTGNFKEVGALLGVAYDSFGAVLGSMGIESADWNHDGWMDLYITPYQRQLAPLFQNHKGKYFEDITRQAGAASGTYSKVKWGVGIVDLDNDTHRDLFVACGHLIDNVDDFDTSTTYSERNVLLRNTGKGKFEDISDVCGDGLVPKLSSRGAAFDDLDNDGDLDVVVLNSRSAPTILRNETKSSNHWLQIQLQGQTSNRDGIGARVTVKSGNLIQIDEVHSGRSYQSDFGKRLQFGLGSQKQVDEIRVQWIGGSVDVIRDVNVDRLITIVEKQAPLSEPAPNN